MGENCDKKQNKTTPKQTHKQRKKIQQNQTKLS